MEDLGVCFAEKCDIHHSALDQAVITATEWLYRKRYLVDVLIELEDEDESDDKRRQSTLEFLRNNTLISSNFQL
jgi:hypothetical protein